MGVEIELYLRGGIAVKRFDERIRGGESQRRFRVVQARGNDDEQHRSAEVYPLLPRDGQRLCGLGRSV